MRPIAWKLLTTLMVPVLLLVLAACAAGGATGKAVFAISDAAADMGAVSKIEMTINSVQIHAQGGAWTTVSSQAQTFDLLELRAKGAAQLLAQADLQAGAYDQLRLDVSKVIVVNSTGQHEAKLPSNTLQVKGDLVVEANTTATAHFDFLADQSLHLTGDGLYIMAPVIKLETKSNADVQVNASNEVIISGGSTTTDTQVGMDTEGSVDVGLRITPDAVLNIAASGKIVQPKGQALAVGTIKAVDEANGTVTITTKSGTDIILHLASDSDIKVKGSVASLTALSGNIGARIITEFNAETQAITDLHANAGAKAQAEVGAKVNLNGTIKSVNAAAGTITVTADSGVDVVLKVGSQAEVQLGGIAVNLLGLGANIGSRIQGEVDASGRTAAELQGEAEANVTASGILKAVDVTNGTVTITTQAGTDVTLEMASRTRVSANGALATLATLKALIGSDVTVAYDQKTKIASDLNAQAKADQSATVTGVIKAANPAEGTVTITTSSGEEIVLNVTAASSIVADGAISTLVSLAGSIGAQVSAQYNAQTKTATSISAQTQASAFASISGTVKAVNVLSNTITVTGEAGTEVVLNIGAQSQVLLNGSATTLVALAASLGSQVTVEYNLQTKVANSVRVLVGGETTTPPPSPTATSEVATVSGTLKSVNTLAGTVTIATSSGQEVILNVTVAMATSLAANIGAQVTAQYNVQTNTAVSIGVQ